MRKNLTKKTLCLSAAACLLVGGLTVGRAAAYFTSYAETGGSVAMNMGFTTIVPDETVTPESGQWIKHIKVQNTGEYPCFVRVKLLYGSAYTVDPISGEGWTKGDDDYYYYGSVVAANGGTTENELTATVKAPGNAEEPPEDGLNFNVIVVTECTPVIYVDGQPTADWNSKDVVIRKEESPMVEEGE